MAQSELILGKFSLNSRVSFQVYPSALYGDIFRNCIPDGQLPASLVSKLGFADPEAEHAKVYPYLPSGAAQDSASSYGWLTIIREDGERVAIGLPWIKVETIEVVSVVTANVTIPDISSGDTDKIRLALSAAGFSNFEIKTTSS